MKRILRRINRKGIIMSAHKKIFECELIIKSQQMLLGYLSKEIENLRLKIDGLKS